MYRNQLENNTVEAVRIMEKFRDLEVGSLVKLSSFFIDVYTRSILSPGVIFWGLHINEFGNEIWIKLEYIGFIKGGLR